MSKHHFGFTTPALLNGFITVGLLISMAPTAKAASVNCGWTPINNSETSLVVPAEPDLLAKGVPPRPKKLAGESEDK